MSLRAHSTECGISTLVFVIGFKSQDVDRRLNSQLHRRRLAHYFQSLPTSEATELAAPTPLTVPSATPRAVQTPAHRTVVDDVSRNGRQYS